MGQPHFHVTILYRAREFQQFARKGRDGVDPSSTTLPSQLRLRPDPEADHVPHRTEAPDDQ